MQTPPKIMGILNLTPDSFSDGGVFNAEKLAVKRALEIEKEGADIIDIGGESTGPGSENVELKEELKRTIQIIKEIRKHTQIPISIDTYKAKVAEEALKAGANIINDITALRGNTNEKRESKMACIAKKYNCPIILMYSKDQTARTSKIAKEYEDIIKTLKEFFTERLNYAEKQGIKKENIILDTGMGAFISTIPKYSYETIARLAELKTLKHPLLIGISRKSFLGGSMKNREQKALPLSAIAHLNGVSIIRTHNVKETKEFFEEI